MRIDSEGLIHLYNILFADFWQIVNFSIRLNQHWVPLCLVQLADYKWAVIDNLALQNGLDLRCRTFFYLISSSVNFNESASQFLVIGSLWLNCILWYAVSHNLVSGILYMVLNGKTYNWLRLIPDHVVLYLLDRCNIWLDDALATIIALSLN